MTATLSMTERAEQLPLTKKAGGRELFFTTGKGNKYN